MKTVNSTFNKVVRHIRLGVHLTDAHIFSMYSKEMQPLVSPPLPLEFEELIHPTNEDCDALVEIGFYTPTTEYIVKYLSEGQHCYVARHQGKIISCFWAIQNEFYDHRLKRVIKLANEEIYLLGGYTLPDYRGKGIRDYLFEKVAMANIYTGGNRAVAFVDVHNHSSIRAVEKIGFKKVGRIGYVSVLGMRLQYIFGRHILSPTQKRFIINR